MSVVQISLLIVTFLSYMTEFVINANHQRIQPTPSHCAMCQHVECQHSYSYSSSSYATC